MNRTTATKAANHEGGKATRSDVSRSTVASITVNGADVGTERQVDAIALVGRTTHEGPNAGVADL